MNLIMERKGRWWRQLWCMLVGHILPPWPHPWRKNDNRLCLRCGVLGESRKFWLTNEEYHNTENIRIG